MLLPEALPASNELQTFLAPLASRCQEFYDWPLARFEVHTYLHAHLPPEPFITSVRAVVLRNGTASGALSSQTERQVLVVQDPDGYHILPGGRREANETVIGTVQREVLEETGWQVIVEQPIGFKHFRRLTPKPPEITYPHPDFVQLIYAAEAKQYTPTAREIDGYEISSYFVALSAVGDYNLLASDQHILHAAFNCAPKKNTT